MNLASRIQELRNKKGYSQEELAEQLGVSRQAVSKWETGQSIPDLDKITAMSNLFEVTTDYMIKGTEPKQHTADPSGKNLYTGLITVSAVAAGLWSFTANRFRYDECILIILAGAAVGYGLALIIQGAAHLIRNKNN